MVVKWLHRIFWLSGAKYEYLKQSRLANKKQLPNGWGCCTINLWAATFLQVATLEATFLCPTDCTHSQIDWWKFAIKHRLIYESRQIVNTEEHLLFCKTCVMVAAASVDLFKQEGRCECSARMLAKSFHCLELHILLYWFIEMKQTWNKLNGLWEGGRRRILWDDKTMRLVLLFTVSRVG